MPTIDVEGKKIELTEDGYLANYDDWNEKVACAIADREGVSKKCPLTPEKLEIIRYMREYYNKFHAFPIPRYICKNVHQPKECTYEEFPDPIAAWKIAGLPDLLPEVYATITKIKSS